MAIDLLSGPVGAFQKFAEVAFDIRQFGGFEDAGQDVKAMPRIGVQNRRVEFAVGVETDRAAVVHFKARAVPSAR